MVAATAAVAPASAADEAVAVRLLDERHAVAHVVSAVHYTQDGTSVRRPSLATATLRKLEGVWLIETFHNTITGGPGYMFGPPPAARTK